MGGGPVLGLIEGFYGPPWSWDRRVEVMRWCHERGMTHYLYAPKDDPRHRTRWREPYPADELAGFERLVAAGTLEVGFAISPGLSMDYGDADDRAALLAKLDQVTALGVTLVCLAVDDIPMRPGLGEDHAALTTWLREQLDGRAALVLVPTDYAGTHASPYLDALAAGVPEDVPIGWTGQWVVNDGITATEAAARAAAVGGRPPLLWDNYPVNDATMGDRLFLGPLRGRDADLLARCSGYLANPMVQPLASTLPLASIAAWLGGGDPDAAWERAADELGWRTFAEACDAARPGRLVGELVDARGPDERRVALAACRAWFDAAATCGAPGLEDEAGPWLQQVHDEANVALTALRLLHRLWPDAGPADNARAVEQAMALTFLWPLARRGTVTVLGPRCAFRPVIGQWPDGEWRYTAGALEEDANVVDRLVRFALAELAALER